MIEKCLVGREREIESNNLYRLDAFGHIFVNLNTQVILNFNLSFIIILYFILLMLLVNYFINLI